jgi:RNA polymerase sigma factor (sigma-70 family)
MKYRQTTHGSWEDLQQEVLIRFGQWLPKYRAEANGRTIFEKIATNVLIDAHRRENATRRLHEEIDLDELQSDIVGNNPWNGIETRIFLNECSSSLSDAELGMLHEHFVEGRSLRQMATNHGVSAPTISKKLERILTKLGQQQKLQRISIAEAA